MRATRQRTRPLKSEAYALLCPARLESSVKMGVRCAGGRHCPSMYSEVKQEERAEDMVSPSTIQYIHQLKRLRQAVHRLFSCNVPFLA